VRRKHFSQGSNYEEGEQGVVNTEGHNRYQVLGKEPLCRPRAEIQEVNREVVELGPMDAHVDSCRSIMAFLLLSHSVQAS
jgi:hypothetical protein